VASVLVATRHSRSLVGFPEDHAMFVLDSSAANAMVRRALMDSRLRR
jgi:hypothetical protein